MPEAGDLTPGKHEPRDSRAKLWCIRKKNTSRRENAVKSRGGLNRAQQGEGAVEGRFDNWGEVVTRQPYRKVRLDHLLSKEIEQGFFTVELLM